MDIWCVSLGLALISYTCTAQFHNHTKCSENHHCKNGKCCQGHCSIGRFCSCEKDSECSSGEFCYRKPFWNNICVSCSASRRHSRLPRCLAYSLSPAPTSAPYTHLDNNNYCVGDSDCEGSSVCKGGQCRGQDGGAFTSSGSIIVTIICLVVLAITLLFLYRRARKPPGVATQNAYTNRATDHEMHQEMPFLMARL